MIPHASESINTARAGVKFYHTHKSNIIAQATIDSANSLSIEYSVYDEMTLSERQVADCLQELKLWWRYESPVFLEDEKGRPRIHHHKEFCLPSANEP